jgi:hypothetical protein
MVVMHDVPIERGPNDTAKDGSPESGSLNATGSA